MRRAILLASVVLTSSLVLSGCAQAGAVWSAAKGGAGGGHARNAHWGYEGHNGPEAWGAMAKGFATCDRGIQQSPVDLVRAIRADPAAAAPRLDWRPVQNPTVVNNGHTIQVNLPGGGGLELEGVAYELKQVHFHHVSEHTIDGRAFPMEAHFVHATPDGHLAVVGVMLIEGAPMAALDAVWAAAPSHEGEVELHGGFDPNAFLPADRRAYHYAGSLTTPPCTESVKWTVFATPLSASSQQIGAFAHAFHNNARPVQPLHRRFVLQTSG